MTPLKVIGSGLAGLLVVPVLVIGAFAGGFGAGPSSQPLAMSSLDAIPIDAHGLIAAVLSDRAIAVTPNARGDVALGRIDPRVLQILLVISQTHELAPVGPLITGHSRFVAGTDRVSNHPFGRAVDILGVDGAPVSIDNPAAREVMVLALSLAPPLRPDELGGPFPFADPSVRTFTEGHHDHIHIGWDRPWAGGAP